MDGGDKKGKEMEVGGRGKGTEREREREVEAGRWRKVDRGFDEDRWGRQRNLGIDKDE